MANLDNFHILPEQEELFYKAVTVRDGFFGTKADKKFMEYRKRNFKSLIEQSQFPTIAEAWNSLSDAMKLRWESAGSWSFQSGWDLFAQDTSYRMTNHISGLGDPSDYHQFKVGHIHIGAPATSIIIKQPFPLGKGRTFDMSINFMSKLVSVGAGSYASLFLNFYIYENGEYYWASEEVSFYENGWWSFNGDSYDLNGVDIREVYMSIEVHNMQGDLYFDGVSLVSEDVNLANDYNCNNIDTSWQAVSVPATAFFESIYSRNSFYK